MANLIQLKQINQTALSAFIVEVIEDHLDSTGAIYTANRALVTDSSGDVTVSSVTSAEVGYLSGVTSAIQTQLGAKLGLAGGVMTGPITATGGLFEQRDSTTAQTFRVYGTYTDASNYVRASLAATSTGVTLAAETAGTGADNIPIYITPAGSGGVILTGAISSSGASNAFSSVANIPAISAFATATGNLFTVNTSSQPGFVTSIKGVAIHLPDGYDDNALAACLYLTNNTDGTGTDLNIANSNGPSKGLVGIYSNVFGASNSSGSAIAVYGDAGASSANGQKIGVLGKAVGNFNAATDIGVAGFAIIPTGGGIGIGGYFGLQAATPTFVSAALVADNGATTAPIFIGRDNGTEVIRVSDGGLVGIGTASPTSYLDIPSSTTSAASLRIRTGTAPTSPNSGDIWHDSTQKTLSYYAAGLTQTVNGVLFTQTNTVTVANTVTETALTGTGVGTLTLPASFFAPGKTIKMRMLGYHSSTASPDITIRFKFGSTTILTTGVISSGNGSNNTWICDCFLTCRTTGVTGTIIGQGYYEEIHGTGNRGGMVNTTTTTIDTTSSQVISVTAEWGTADAGNTISCTNVLIEILN